MGRGTALRTVEATGSTYASVHRAGADFRRVGTKARLRPRAARRNMESRGFCERYTAAPLSLHSRPNQLAQRPRDEGPATAVPPILAASRSPNSLTLAGVKRDTVNSCTGAAASSQSGTTGTSRPCATSRRTIKWSIAPTPAPNRVSSRAIDRQTGHPPPRSAFRMHRAMPGSRRQVRPASPARSRTHMCPARS